MTDESDESEALIAAAREKAEWRWPIPINYLPGDPEHTMLVALRHAYVIGVGDAAGFRRQEPITDAQVDRAEEVFWVHKEETGESWGAMRAALEAARNSE